MPSWLNPGIILLVTTSSLLWTVLAESVTAAPPAFGSVSAFGGTISTLQNLSRAGIESGHATSVGVPVAVQEAYLKSVIGNDTATGHQSVSHPLEQSQKYDGAHVSGKLSCACRCVHF